jgi:DNA-binding XRE family transcriptional regulator
MSRGLSYESFAAMINVSRRTLYMWEKDHPEWNEAKEIGQEHCQLVWEKMGVAGSSGNIRHFNATSWMFNMRCRFRDQFADLGHLAAQAQAAGNGVTINLAYDPGAPLQPAKPLSIDGVTNDRGNDNETGNDTNTDGNREPSE